MEVLDGAPCRQAPRQAGHGDALGPRRLQGVEHQERGGLPLLVGVGGQDQAVGLLRLVGDRLQLLGLVGVILPFHREPVIRVHRSVLRGQVADVAVAGEDAIIRAEVLFDGFRLGGRFDDDELHCA